MRFARITRISALYKEQGRPLWSFSGRGGHLSWNRGGRGSLRLNLQLSLGKACCSAQGFPPAQEPRGHILGGDVLGRDELSRLLHGARVSMIVAFAATAIATFIGVMVGLLSGYVGGRTDTGLMRLVDLVLSMPFLLLAIVMQRVWDSPGLAVICVILGVLSWTTLARVTRAKTMEVGKLEFVEAGKALGLSHRRIVFRHILPNVVGPIIAIATILVARMIIAESALSFLGLGVRPPIASWGSMLQEAERMVMGAPRLTIFPAILISMAVFGFNLFGEGLRDAFDPKD